MRQIIRKSWALGAIAVAAACIEFKDDSAKKQESGNVAAQAVDSSDISVPSYEAFALDTAGSWMAI